MKILIICDKKDEKYVQKAKDLKEELCSNKMDSKINVFIKYSKNQKYDILVIFSDDINFIQGNLKLIENEENIVVITDNLSSSYIIECIKITPNLCYAGNDINVIAKKVLSVCIRNEA